MQDDKEHGKQLLDARSNAYVKSLLNVLLDRIPVEKRERAPVSDDVIRKKFQNFLDSPAEEREFHFMKKNALVAIAKRDKIKLTGATSISAIIAILANPPPPTSTATPTATPANEQ